MSKKYLLYIHDQRFQQVEHKSRLVNSLLLEHFGSREPSAQKLPNKQPVTPPKNKSPILEQLDKLIKEKNVKFCKNNHPIPDNKSKCLGKGCQYA